MPFYYLHFALSFSRSAVEVKHYSIREGYISGTVIEVAASDDTKLSKEQIDSHMEPVPYRPTGEILTNFKIDE